MTTRDWTTEDYETEISKLEKHNADLVFALQGSMNGHQAEIRRTAQLCEILDSIVCQTHCWVITNDNAIEIAPLMKKIRKIAIQGLEISKERVSIK